MVFLATAGTVSYILSNWYVLIVTPYITRSTDDLLQLASSTHRLELLLPVLNSYTDPNKVVYDVTNFT